MFRKAIDRWKRSWRGEGLLPNRKNKIEDVYWRYYNGNVMEEYVEFPLSEACQVLDDESFDRNSPTVLYVHGYFETTKADSIQVMVSAYLQARPGTNVILLDWSNMAHGSFLFNAVRNTKEVGQATAEQINKLLEAGIPTEKLHIVAHSLGSHIAGYIGRELKNKYNKTLKRLTALDPTMIAFYPNDVVMKHVCAQDAEFVDVIHTSAGGHGTPVRTGTADFWPNGGKSVQPGCPRFSSKLLSKENLCSHCRSWRFYAESVRNPEAFPASPAKSYKKFKRNPSPEIGMVYMGFNCDTSVKGSYYLTTNAQTPFGKGMDGLYSKSKKEETQTSAINGHRDKQ